MKKSFGLIEVVVVMGLFLFMIGTVITITAVASRNLILNENRWKASLIAQSYIEQVRNKRDNNILDTYNGRPTDWDSGFNQIIKGSSTHCYDANLIEITPCGPDDWFFQATFFNPDLFVYPPPPPPPPVLKPNSKLVYASVQWKQFGQIKTIYYTDFIKDIFIPTPEP